MKSVLRGALAAVVILTVAMGSPASAQGSDYPNRPIRLIVPFPAGGPTDILARVVGQRMGEQLGQTVLVDNRPGANTVIAATAVAKSPADGYTLLMAIDNTLAMNQFLYSKLPYDPLNDFEAVGKVAVSPLIIVTTSQGPKSMDALLTQVKAGAAKVSYGYGTFTTQFAAEMLRREVGKEMVDVPYKGSAALTQGLLTSDVQFTIDGITAALPHIQKGTFRALGKFSKRPLPALPQVPSLSDAGLNVPDIEAWLALVAPRGTPPAIVARLNRELLKALAAKDVQQKLNDVGLDAEGSTPEALREFIVSESAKWGPVIKSTGVKVD